MQLDLGGKRHGQMEKVDRENQPRACLAGWINQSPVAPSRRDVHRDCCHDRLCQAFMGMCRGQSRSSQRELLFLQANAWGVIWRPSGVAMSDAEMTRRQSRIWLKSARCREKVHEVSVVVTEQREVQGCQECVDTMDGGTLPY